jgi:phospholipid/cholesterol/gamma-HCH transport system substrate-binding protein
MKLRKEVRIGLIVAIVMAFFIWGLNFLKGRNIFTTSKQYYAIFRNIGGLQKSSIVSANGYNVGQVSEIEFMPGNINHILVEISVERGFKLPKNTVIEIYSIDFMGSKAVNLILGNSPVIAQENDTLLSRFDGDLNTLVSKKLMPLKDKAENLIVSIDSVMTIIRSTFTPQTQKDIRLSIASLRELMESQKARVQTILENFESVSQNLQASNKSITKIVDNISQVSDSLAAADIKATIDKTREVLAKTNNILEKINSGQGTLGQLINNDSLYFSIEKTLNDIDSLVSDLNKNPKRYVHFSIFGKKDKTKK